MKEKLAKVFDILGKIVAIVWILVFILLLTNAKWGYMNGIPWLLNIFNIIKTYGALLLVAIVGFEAVAKRNIVFKILYLLCLAIIVVFMFFPETYANLIGLI